MIEMNVGQGVGGIRCVAARGSGIGRSEGTTDVGIHNNMGTSWAFDTNKKVDVLVLGLSFGPYLENLITGVEVGNCERPSFQHLEFARLLHNSVGVSAILGPKF